MGPRGWLINLALKLLRRSVTPSRLPHTSLHTAIFEGRALPLRDTKTSQDDLAFLQYTGGTTGLPKGVLLDQRTTAVHQRPNIYTEGPSQFGGSGEVADLIRRYVGPPPRKLIDVGCGLGFYGRGLLADGYDWIGAEVDAARWVVGTQWHPEDTAADDPQQLALFQALLRA